jgi:hypothetical protein
MSLRNFRKRVVSYVDIFFALSIVGILQRLFIYIKLHRKIKIEQHDSYL